VCRHSSDQIGPINDTFAPSAEDIPLAQKIIAAFDGTKGAGNVAIDVNMFDIPHLKRAKHLLDR
jgi:citrate lyase subunit beta / citryl-CoA lyase